ncbi:MAG: DUF885 family protein [Planctomycetota bacterium]
MDLAALFRRHADLEPEEAETLGVPDRDEHRRDMSEEGEAARRAFWDEALAGTDGGDEHDLDLRALRRHARLERHLDRGGWARANPQWALYPYAMLRYRLARRGGDPSEGPDAATRARAAGVPRFLDEHRRALRAEAERGRVAHRSFLESLVAHELPAARDFLAALDPGAGSAVDRHLVFLRDELRPLAPEHAILGAEEYAERLRLTHGLTDSLEALVAEAREALATTREAMLEVARTLPGGASIRDFGSLRTHMVELQRETLPASPGPEAWYRATMGRVMEGLVARGEFAPFDLDRLGMDVYPEGMRDQGAGTNWPAPLLDPRGRGQFVIHPDPGAHPRAWASVLAVHEGVPGHTLQSAGFQRRFAGAAAPFRFLAVADDVAIPRLNFSAMLSIEGWAVYAESLVREAGLHSGVDLLFAHAADALRAVRVIAEIDLHRGALAPAEVEPFVCENAGLASARWELERYQRGPLQAVAYFFGARRIRALRERTEAVEGAGFSAARFHEALLAAGPVRPDDLTVVG